MLRTLFLGAVLLLVPMIAYAAAVPSVEYTHPQKLIAVEGARRINLFCEGNGAPTVLFDTGLGDSMMVWRLVQGEVAKTTRACSYDRAGLGFSDPAKRPSDASAVVEDIHHLLQAAKIKTPVLYVGHSIAGLYGVLLAARYPGDVAGEVLVDPSIADQEEREMALLPPAARPKSAAMMTEFLGQLRGCLVLAKQNALTNPVTKQAKACVDVSAWPAVGDAVLRQAITLQIAQVPYNAETVSEMENFAGVQSPDQREVEAAQPRFGDKPLIVLTHSVVGHDPDLTPAQDAVIFKGWNDGHDRLAALSIRGSNTVVPNSHHYIEIDQPGAVIAAVDKAIAEVRATK